MTYMYTVIIKVLENGKVANETATTFSSEKEAQIFIDCFKRRYSNDIETKIISAPFFRSAKEVMILDAIMGTLCS